MKKVHLRIRVSSRISFLVLLVCCFVVFVVLLVLLGWWFCCLGVMCSGTVFAIVLDSSEYCHESTISRSEERRVGKECK